MSQEPPQRRSKRTSTALRSADDPFAELIRQAKTARVAEAEDGPSSSGNATNAVPVSSAIVDSVESTLTCPICDDLLYHPVTVVDCLHTFCGACIKTWMERGQQSRCPTCRAHIKYGKDDFRTSSLLEAYLKTHPDRERSEDERKELDATYKPGRGIGNVPRRREVYVDDDDADDDDEDMMDEDEEEEEEVAILAPCPCCYPPDPNPYNYRCPMPIPNSRNEPGFQGRYTQAMMHHGICRECARPFPQGMLVQNRPLRCDGCLRCVCGNVFQCPGPRLKQLREPWQTMPFAGTIALPMLFHAPMHVPNLVEGRIFENWRTTNNFSELEILNRVREWLLSPNLPASLRVPVLAVITRDSWICEYCIRGLIETLFFYWWIYERPQLAVQDNRPNCWWGDMCRTQDHNVRHAEKLNHSCLKSRP